MIEVQNLSKQYGRIRAVENISFTVEKGEVVGFLGPNGAGKSTTMNIITGFLPASEGTVKVCGFDVFEEPIEVKKRIGYLPEQPPIYMDMTVWEYLKFACELKKVKKSEREEQLEKIMELVKIKDVSRRLIKNLSKGYKQRVGLAQALIGSPEVLILDEPTVGLDPKQIIEIRNLIKELGKEHTVILSSHILQEVSAVCEKVIIINKGQIVAVDTPENLAKSVAGASRLSITVEGPKDKVLSKIKSVKGVKYADVSTKSRDNLNSFLIETEKDIDIRKDIFFAMADEKYPILEMKPEHASLEDIFLQVTSEQGNENKKGGF